MASGIYNIEVEQGASFQFEVDIDGNSDFDTNFNTNAISYVGTIRDKYSDSSAKPPTNAAITLLLSNDFPLLVGPTSKSACPCAGSLLSTAV